MKELRLTECFTYDLRKSSEKVSLKSILRRYLFSPSYKAVLQYRLARYFYEKEIHIIKRIPYLSAIIRMHCLKTTGAEIAFTARIGKGLRIAHPNGIVIGKGVEIGENVTLFSDVVIGGRQVNNDDEKVELISSSPMKIQKNNMRSRYPNIGNNVIIYSGARIIGPIEIGNGVIVGANSVVLNSVPHKTLVAGIPAKEMKKL